MFFQIQPPAEPEVDLSLVYDAVVVGTGAAGGVAADVLTSHGMKVLLRTEFSVGPVRSVSAA